MDEIRKMDDETLRAELAKQLTELERSARVFTAQLDAALMEPDELERRGLLWVVRETRAETEAFAEAMRTLAARNAR